MQELIVFARAPRPGAVKTRLAREIGAEEACAAYQVLLRALSASLASLENVTVQFAPEDGRGEVEPFFPSTWRFAPQSSGDLGARMQAAFASAFARGCTRVVLIGSDCPYLTPADIQAAWSALDSHDIVFGPAEDGGYWLIGARIGISGVFEEVSWGTNQVLEQSIARCRARGLSVGMLRCLPDIDTLTDWERYQTCGKNIIACG